MESLDQKILDEITVRPGQKARDIAKKLNIERSLVNSILYGRLKGKVKQDKNYRWYLEKTIEIIKKKDEKSQLLNTPLAKLCRYYLDCLSYDDLEGVSVFAESKYGDLDYFELETLPISNNNINKIFDSDAGRQLLAKFQRDRYRKVIYLGYPISLHFIRSQKGWEGFTLEPLFLFPIDIQNKLILWDDLHINFKAFKTLSKSDSLIMEEVIQLLDELGLSNTDNSQPDLDEMFTRLREIRSNWDWQEDPNIYRLTTNNAPIAKLNKQGIYNRAILVITECSRYTKGLEIELGMMQSIEETKYENSAIGAWLRGQEIKSVSVDQHPILEVLPLNNEQRQAVLNALSNLLTVITGPPGTGKSQVVTSILINAAWQRKSILFASKNNKAVDVVETRINALGPYPILFRLGAIQYKAKIGEYLISLLSAKATQNDFDSFNEYLNIHNNLQKESDILDAEIHSLIELRNEIDHLEKKSEEIRHDIGDEIFKRLRGINKEQFEKDILQLKSSINQFDRSKQSFITSFIWPFIRKMRFKKLYQNCNSINFMANQIGLSVPDYNIDSIKIDHWTKYVDMLSKIMFAIEYFEKLELLNAVRPIEELNRLRLKLNEKIFSNSLALWKSWLNLEPNRLKQEDRKILGDYSALLKMISSVNEHDQKISSNVFRNFYQLFPKITSILPCWAVTSLSAHGSIPLVPNFFDLLVIDEASQCDIASVLPLLYRARRVVVIGDTNQLRHISTLHQKQDNILLMKHDLVHDYSCWAYSSQSLFDLATSLCSSDDIIALRDHHRSHADIIGFSNEAFYKNSLRIATNYDKLRRPNLEEPAVRWIDVKGKAVRPHSGGALNEDEALAVIKEIERLINQGYRGSIGVVSPFKAQANRIRDLINNHDNLIPGLLNADFLSETVHKFQGDERDVMIFSPAVSSGVSEGALRFLRNNRNLFNVAITRARSALIIVGDNAAALNCKVSYLADFAAYVDRMSQKKQSYNYDVHIIDLGPNYPTVSNPEKVSPWEQIFYNALYKKNIHSIPQYPIDKYVLDFAIILGDRRLNIEIDGEHYHRNWDGELCRRDQIKNQRLMELGWDVMRFWVYQVRDDLDKCMQRVERWIKNK